MSHDKLEKDFDRLPSEFIIPSTSEREKLLRKIDRRDKAVKALEFLVLVIVVGLTTISNVRLSEIGFNNEKNIAEHRQQTEDNITSVKNQLDKVNTASKARADIGLCLFSVPYTSRTPEYVKSCYDQIEKQYGIKVQRFGDGRDICTSERSST